MQAIQLFSITGSIIIYLSIIELIRRGMLKERYSLLWLFTTALILLLSLWRGLLDKAAGLVGIAYAPSLLFLVIFIFLLLIVLHFSVVLSDLSEKNKTLAQDVALLKASLEGGNAIKKDRN